MSLYTHYLAYIETYSNNPSCPTKHTCSSYQCWFWSCLSVLYMCFVWRTCIHRSNIGRK